jgi:hypothetical protein
LNGFSLGFRTSGGWLFGMSVYEIRFLEMRSCQLLANLKKIMPESGLAKAAGQAHS